MLLLTVVLLWALGFLPTLPLPGKDIPPRKGDESRQYHLKGNQDGVK